MATVAPRLRRPLGPRVRAAVAAELRPLLRIGEDGLARTLLIGLALAQLLDVLTTSVLLGGGRIEANPLSAMVIAGFGLPGLLLMKTMLTLGIGGYAGGFDPPTTRLLLAGAALLSFAAVGWNIAVAGVPPS